MHKLLEPKEPKDRKAKIKERRAKHARMEPGEKKQTNAGEDKNKKGLLSRTEKKRADKRVMNPGGVENKGAQKNENVLNTMVPELTGNDQVNENDQEVGVVNGDRKKEGEENPEIKKSTVEIIPLKKIEKKEDAGLLLKNALKIPDVKNLIKLKPDAEKIIEEEKSGPDNVLESPDGANKLAQLTENTGDAEKVNGVGGEEKEKEGGDKPKSTEELLSELTGSEVSFKKKKGILAWFIRGKLEKRRQKANAIATAFIKEGAEKIKELSAFASTIRTRLESGAETQKTIIATTLDQQIKTISDSAQKNRDKANADAEATIKQIKSDHGKTIWTVNNDMSLSKSEIDKRHTEAYADTVKAKQEQYKITDDEFVSAQDKVRAAGVKAGGNALSKVGQMYLDEMRGKKNVDDSFLDGPYTYNVAKARADAAISVGKSFNESLIQIGKDQAESIDDGKDSFKTSLDQKWDEVHITLLQQFTESSKTILAAQSQGIVQANKLRNSLLDSVKKSLEATLAAIDKSESDSKDMLTKYAATQTQAIEDTKQSGISELEGSASKSISGMVKGLTDIKETAAAEEAPDEKGLVKQIADSKTKFMGIYASVFSSLNTTLEGMEKGQIDAGTSTVTDINSIADSTTQDITSIAEEFVPTLEELKKSSDEGFGEMRKSTNAQGKKMREKIAEGYSDIMKNTRANFTAMGTGLHDSLEEAIFGTKDPNQLGIYPSLNNMVYKDEEGNMPGVLKTEMDKAGNDVQPRWKGWLKILIMIIVILVVAFVLGPLLIGFLAGFMSTFAAGVVGGAILGAASGAVLKMSDNLIDGKPLFEGVVDAMIVGAIGGAMGGLGGGLGKFLGSKAGVFFSAAPKLATTVTKLAVNFGMDILGGVAGSVYMNPGGPLDWGQIIKGAGIGLAMGAATDPSIWKSMNFGGPKFTKFVDGVESFQNRMTQRGGAGADYLKGRFGGTPKFTPGDVTVDMSLDNARLNSKNKPPGFEEPGAQGANKNKGGQTVDPAGNKGGKTNITEETIVPGGGKKGSKTGTTETDETPTVDNKKSNKKNSNDTDEQDQGLPPKKQGIRKQVNTNDGEHELKLTDKGKVIRCSMSCAELEVFYQKQLAGENNPLKGELNEINKMPRGTPEEVDAYMDSVRDFEAKLSNIRKSNMTGGQLQAERKGWPEAPEGYEWVEGKNGVPFVRRKSVMIEEGGVTREQDEIIFDQTDNTFKNKPAGGSQDWDAHQTKVNDEVNNTYGEDNVAPQAKLKVMVGNEEIEIHPDNLVKKGNKYYIVDAKQQQDGLIASGQKNPTYTENQAKTYPGIRSGNISKAKIYGAAANKFQIEPGKEIMLGSEIEIHTNDVSGNVVKFDYNGARLP